MTKVIALASLRRCSGILVDRNNLRVAGSISNNRLQKISVAVSAIGATVVQVFLTSFLCSAVRLLLGLTREL
jgi:hypothetical protein